jgi:uncharacterized protein YdeI (YjbR/CyaY-like superfamily)
MSILPDNSVHPEDRHQWRSWLEHNHTRNEGIWLVIWKKASGRAKLTYAGAVEEALCFGWIDSKPNKLDDHRSLLWFASRKAGAGWSCLNKVRVEKLITAGQMMPAGLAKAETAKADGSWNALDAVEDLEIPDDLAAAFAQHQHAAAYFDQFPRWVKRNILEWIGNAKTAATRMKRITETATKAEANERANQWRQSPK